MFEEVRWTTAAIAATEWAARPIQGEFTLVLGGASPTEADLDEKVKMVLTQIETGVQMSEAVRSVASGTGVSRRVLYEEVLARTRGTSP